MLHLLKRHPWRVQAHFDWSLALVFALPVEKLRPLLPPGLEPDTYGEWGFVAAAFVQTRRLRPSWAPSWMAQDFFLAGYRIFVRSTLPDGRRRRGLYILGSDTDSRRMVRLGTVLTHYGYRLRIVNMVKTDEQLSLEVRQPAGQVEVSLQASLTPATSPPPDSPFPDLVTARRFAGPMPFTFSHEPETNSLVVVEGARQHWIPRPVSVQVQHLAFFQREPFASQGLPLLANAFYVEDVDYQWARGVVTPITPSNANA
ncbi:DUF2071 domain-containing protein [Roseimicrobium sp. ORNL1]|uniref:DUF2071 domain-containing protein n=1 Tax=Roseimicrobium sp. ORNL1 TaxID=2711231 RepID=UPI0013E152A9|nr:DUF2071 domain-containing protein [Roseimicrobium sp. ORNL1]QIF00676.1 hypothetical protein G5S37_03780 [Roseimicrobium sp. ORNL1]